MSEMHKKMENRMLQNQLEAYLDNYGIKENALDVAFEHFANYCMFSLNAPEAYHNDNLFHQSVHTGKGGDWALDGIMILINDTPVTTLAEAKAAISLKRAFSAKFFFVQAKTSSKFESGEILKVGYGVRNFFKEGKMNANAEVRDYKVISDYIFKHSIDFVEQPTCAIYYVSTGTWMDDEYLKGVLKDQINTLNSLNYFSAIEYVPVDVNRLMTIYKELNNSITREVVIAKNVAFPEIKGAEKAYLGIISVGEYLKLITDETGALLQGVFYDNVRGYLGDNPVNQEIQKTIENKENYMQFPILNNGITIVAKKMNVSGEKFKLTDYQIVNGCQTSNVIYRCRNGVDMSMMIPVKIVHTESPELVNSVIRSTNRQTQVLDEAFESLKQFHKQLQEYYNTYKGDDRLYYERRTHEYDDQRGLKRHNIITLPIQLQSFMAMFESNPHSMHRYYGELLKNNKDKVFLPSHKLIAYYAAAKTLNRIEQAMNAGVISIKDWKVYKYHLLLLVRVIVCNLHGYTQLPRINSADMERLCKAILAVVDNKQQFTAILHLSVDVLESSLKDYSKMSRRRFGNGPERTREFTQEMMDNAAKIMKKHPDLFT